MTPAVLVAKFASGVFDTSGKFATSVVDTSGKFSAGVVDKGGAPCCEYLRDFS
jgi:hypothetical protein